MSQSKIDQNGQKICSKCHKTKDKSCFSTFRKKEHHHPNCRACLNKRNRDLSRKHSRDPSKRVKILLRSCRYYDKKKGYYHDLTEKYVEQILICCKYCGQAKSDKEGNVLTLDRIDNSLGHCKDNVVAACKRCNFIKNTMPNKAWLAIVPSVKSAAQSGLFDGWHGFNNKKNS